MGRNGDIVHERHAYAKSDKILWFEGRRLKDIYTSYLTEAQNLSSFLFILGLIPGGGLVFFH